MRNSTKIFDSNLSLSYTSDQNNVNLNSANNFSSELAYESLDKILLVHPEINL